MKLSLDALVVLDAIDRHGSFTAAAQQLYRVPSAITYTIRKLERDLGIALFDRSGHKPVFTEAGLALLQDGRELLKAAQRLQARTQRIATGWESALSIAVEQLIPTSVVLDLFDRFYAQDNQTHLRLSTEILGGSWDALHTGRADLVIGASGDRPPGGGYSSYNLGYQRVVFAVAPGHPLAQIGRPLSNSQIKAHRVVAIADSSQVLKPRSVGILDGQEVLTVPDMQTKYLAQQLGLGVGLLPHYLAAQGVAAGQLVICELEEAPPLVELSLAWRTGQKGKALQWFINEIQGLDLGPYANARPEPQPQEN